jgi:hypothetical protein
MLIIYIYGTGNGEEYYQMQTQFFGAQFSLETHKYFQVGSAS